MFSPIGLVNRLQSSQTVCYIHSRVYIGCGHQQRVLRMAYIYALSADDRKLISNVCFMLHCCMYTPLTVFQLVWTRPNSHSQNLDSFHVNEKEQFF